MRLRNAELVLILFLLLCLARVAWIGSWSAAGARLVGYPQLILLIAVFAGLLFRLARVSRQGLLPLAAALALTLLALKWHWFLLAATGAVLWIGARAHERHFGSFRWDAFLVNGARVAARELRKFAPLLVLVCLYPLVPVIINGAADRDSALHAIDLALFFGHDPVAALERLISTPLSEWLAFCYTAYTFVVMAVVAEAYARGRDRDFERLVFELCLALALGYIGYSLVPARGPLFAQKFGTSLELYQMAGYKELLVDQIRIDRDVFPSLHTAITLILMASCWRASRLLFWLTLPVTLSIPFACVYLRYHYVTDVLAGAVLACAVCCSGLLLYRGTGETKNPRPVTLG